VCAAAPPRSATRDRQRARRASARRRRSAVAGRQLSRLSSLVDRASISSFMRIFKVHRPDPTGLYEQAAAEIRRAIADGEAKPGERLPPARDLAAELGVNTNTVLRSLRLLRDEGLLEFRRGRGVTVAGTPEKGAVIARARDLVSFARQQGYRRDELIQLIEEIA